MCSNAWAIRCPGSSLASMSGTNGRTEPFGPDGLVAAIAFAPRLVLQPQGSETAAGRSMSVSFLRWPRTRRSTTAHASAPVGSRAARKAAQAGRRDRGGGKGCGLPLEAAQRALNRLEADYIGNGTGTAVESS